MTHKHLAISALASLLTVATASAFADSKTFCPDASKFKCDGGLYSLSDSTWNIDESQHITGCKSTGGALGFIGATAAAPSAAGGTTGPKIPMCYYYDNNAGDYKLMIVNMSDDYDWKYAADTSNSNWTTYNTWYRCGNYWNGSHQSQQPTDCPVMPDPNNQQSQNDPSSQ